MRSAPCLRRGCAARHGRTARAEGARDPARSGPWHARANEGRALRRLLPTCRARSLALAAALACRAQWCGASTDLGRGDRRLLCDPRWPPPRVGGPVTRSPDDRRDRGGGPAGAARRNTEPSRMSGCGSAPRAGSPPCGRSSSCAAWRSSWGCSTSRSLQRGARRAPRRPGGERSRCLARSFDVPGALSVTAGLGLVTFGIVGGGRSGVIAPAALESFAAGGALLGLLVLIEGRLSAAPLVPLAVLRSRAQSGANVVVFCLGAVTFSMWFLLTLHLQQMRGLSSGQLPQTGPGRHDRLRKHGGRRLGRCCARRGVPAGFRRRWVPQHHGIRGGDGGLGAHRDGTSGARCG